MTLESLLHEARGRGLDGLTLYRTKNGQWQAGSRWGTNGWAVRIADEPAEAIADALGGEGYLAEDLGAFG